MPAKRPIGILATAAILGTSTLLGQNSNTGKLKLTTGKEIFLAGCVGCHGPDGKGMPDTTVGFAKPETFPDFTKCDQTTPELDKDWKAVIRDGGPARGFSPIMPSFSEALTSQQMDLVIGHLRSLCKDRAWPRGELNLPRAIITEKAFPENEVVVTTAINMQGAPGVGSEIAYERRIGAKSQRVDEIVVNAAIDDVHAPQSGSGAHVNEIIVHHEIAALDQFDAHLAGQECVFEIR